MKLVDIHCPNCGEGLKVNPEIEKLVCGHCHTEFLVSDVIKYENINDVGEKNIEDNEEKVRDEKIEQLTNKLNERKINCKVCGKEIDYNELGTCEECHQRIEKRLEEKDDKNKKNDVANEEKEPNHIGWWIVFALFVMNLLTCNNLVSIVINILICLICMPTCVTWLEKKNIKLSTPVRIILILVLVAILGSSTASKSLTIKDNSLDNSHDEIMKVLNDGLSSKGEKLESFNNVEVNNTGKNNNYKIYESKVDNSPIKVQLIEKNDKIEAIRTYMMNEELKDESKDEIYTSAGFIIGIIMDNCGYSTTDINPMIKELKDNNYNGDATATNFILSMKVLDYYSEMMMTYNTSELDLIKNVNTRDISERIEDIRIQEIDSITKNIELEIENEGTSIYKLKEDRQTLEKYQNEIGVISFSKKENIEKKDLIKNNIATLISKINTKLSISIPDFNTMLSAEAENWGKENNVLITTSTDYSDSIENGKLISQSIQPGQNVTKGDVDVKLVYSIGKKPTIGELNALKTAQSYSDNMHMSKKRLYKQLTSSYGEGFAENEAQYAIDHVDADWNYNALQTAKSYQLTMNMSKKRIYQQLTSSYGEEFTASEAQYAIDNLEE